MTRTHGSPQAPQPVQLAWLNDLPMSLPSAFHLFTDLAASATGSVAGYLFYRYRLQPAGFRLTAQSDPGYFAWLTASALFGAFWFGTANLHVSGVTGIGRSAFGAIFGGICGVEAWKLAKGKTGSTGIVFVVPLCTGMILGRIGCLHAGVEDYTYGRPTHLPWGFDFGDGVSRHPSPLYESMAIGTFLVLFIAWFHRSPAPCMRTGFYVFTAVYALQRFLIEFSKPYGAVLAGLSVFQIGAIPLLGYAAIMLWRHRGATGSHHAEGDSPPPVLRTDPVTLRDLPASGTGEDRHRGR